MDWLQFFASLVSSLAWPVVTVIAFLLFRKAITEQLLPFVTRLRAGNVEAEFKRVMSQADLPSKELSVEIDAQTEALNEMARPQAATTSLDILSIEVPDDWRALRANPNGFVMEAWSGLEKLLRAQYALSEPNADPNPLMASVIGALIGLKLITSDEAADILRLQAARDIAAHSDEAISEDSANEYHGYINNMLRRLRKRWKVK